MKRVRARRSAIIRNLCDIASKGGNYLLNIGPKGDGSVPAESVKSMRTIGAWMKTHGEAIYDTSVNHAEWRPRSNFPPAVAHFAKCEIARAT